MLQKIAEIFRYSFRSSSKYFDEACIDGKYLNNTFHQTSNQSCSHRATLEQWSKDELLKAVRSLELPHSKDLSKDDLIHKIIIASNPLNITRNTCLGKQSVITKE